MKNFVIPELDRPKNGYLSHYLDSSIEAFSDITGIPVTFFDDKNGIIKEYKKDNKICNMFQLYREDRSLCRKSMSSAGQFASRLGEPYIFTCKAGLTNIAISLIVDEEFLGYFVLGPIVMGEMRSSTIKNFSNLNKMDSSQEEITRMFAYTMPTFIPAQISELALLFYNCVITSVSGDNDYSTLRNQYNKQNTINATIQRYKKEHIELEYPYALEQQLIDFVSCGNAAEAVSTLKELLNQFFILEVGNMEGIRAKCLWLFAILMRIANEGLLKSGDSIDNDTEIINRISDSETFDELLEITISIVDRLAGSMVASVYHGHSQIITQALNYIQRNYRSKVSLNDIEENFYVNASYFSTLFKREVGMTFTDYLNSLRISHACTLLTTTNMGIVDISIASGFEDQSYFTKVFKKINGMTPKVYRYSHMKNQ